MKKTKSEIELDKLIETFVKSINSLSGEGEILCRENFEIFLESTYECIRKIPREKREMEAIKRIIKNNNF